MVILLLVVLAISEAAQGLPVLRPGETIQGEIRESGPVVQTEALQKGYTDAPIVALSFRVEVAAPGTYRIEMRSCFFDAYLVVRDESGTVLAEDDDGLLNTHARVVIDAQPGMSLRVEACALHGGRGAFALSMESGWPERQGTAERRAAALVDSRHCLAEREAVLGPEHLDVATSLNNLAGLLSDQGDTAGARPLFERSLAIREKALGREHPDVATSLNNLGILLQAQGDYAGARPLLERALAIREKALGPDHPDVAKSLNNLAELLRAQGDYAGARPLYERSLAIWERALGPEHPDVANGLNNFAGLLFAQGDFAGARPLLERSLAIREKALGPENPDVATSLNNLAGLLRAQGDYAGARPLYERSLAIRERVLGPEHLDVATSLNNLAAQLYAQGDNAGARPLLERSLAIRERVLGPDNLDVAKSLNNLAELLKAQGDYAGARPLYERSLSIREKALSPEHPDVATSLHSLGSVLQQQGDFAVAVQSFDRSRAIMEKYLPPDHPDLLENSYHLAQCLLAVGRAQEAIDLLRSIEANQAAVQKASSPGLVKTRRLLADALKRDGKPVEAAAVIAATPAPVAQPPALVFFSPDPSPAEIAGRELQLLVGVTGKAGISEVVVQQGGQSYYASALPDALRIDPSGRSAKVTMRFTLPRGQDEMTLRVKAIGGDGTAGEFEERIVRYRPPQRRLFLLAMGVQDYSDPGLHLDSPLNDVRDVVAAFEQQKNTLYSDVRIATLTNADVTVANVLRQRTELLRQAGPEDTIVVFVAGHAVRTDDGEYYFLTPPCTADDPYEGVDRDTLYDLVRWDRLSAGRRVLLIDTCFAGGSLPDATRGTGILTEKAGALGVDLDAKGIYVIAASADDQSAREDKGNGYFTHAVVGGLAGAADRDTNGYVQIEELKDYVRDEVSRRSGRRQVPTMPLVFAGEDFAISKVP